MYRDEEDDLFFVGRDDAMIKTLGYRVSPDEVADALYASGQVVEALVAAEPDDVRGQRIVAYVVLQPTAAARSRSRRSATRELPRYMQPSRIEVRARTSSHDEWEARRRGDGAESAVISPELEGAPRTARAVRSDPATRVPGWAIG